MYGEKEQEFQKVFSAIMNSCGREQLLAKHACFEKVSADTHLPLPQLESYLKLLDEYGFIKYSIEEKYIQVTPFGKRWWEIVE